MKLATSNSLLAMMQKRPQASKTHRELEFSQLQFQLERLEKRLGTDLERPGDFETAREIGHRLRNLRALFALTDPKASNAYR